MSVCTGFKQRKIRAYSRRDFILECSRAEADGYEMYKHSVKTDWPKFWRKKYKAQYRRYYVVDDERMAYFSKKEFDYIVTGKIK